MSHSEHHPESRRIQRLPDWAKDEGISPQGAHARVRARRVESCRIGNRTYVFPDTYAPVNRMPWHREAPEQLAFDRDAAEGQVESDLDSHAEMTRRLALLPKSPNCNS